MVDHKLKPLSFFVALHRDALLPPPRDDYVALGVGGFTPANYPLVLSDSVGNSISHKNKYYSELTGWYWIWKNISDVSVVGLCHYRRYFVLDENDRWLVRRRNRRRFGLNVKNRLLLTPKPAKLYFRPDAQGLGYITAPERSGFVEEALTRFDAIVPRRQPLGSSISTHYAACHFREDWVLFISGIQQLYPEYAAHIKWFDKATYIHPYNMMVASKPFFDTYMSRLFTLLFWMEKERPFRAEPYQCRVPAFLAERFFTFYLHVTGATYAEAPVAISELAAF